MAERRFGPTQAAGVAVVELDAEKLLEAAPLGVTAYVGMLERGAVGMLTSTYSARQMVKKIGNRVAASLVPDAGMDFWNHSNGAGELHFIRITDGTERAASKTFYSRDLNLAGTLAQRLPILKVAAKNGGRWGSRYGAMPGAITGPGDLTPTTVTTGKMMLLNEWAGGTIKFPLAISGKVYTVVSNTTAGVLTLSSDATCRVDYGSATDKNYVLELARDSSTLPFGVPSGNYRELAVVFEPGDNDSVNLFSMKVYMNGSFIRRYPNLSMDTTSQWYAPSIVNNDDGNDEVTLTDLLTPSSPSPARRPFNECGRIGTLAALLLTTDPMQIRSIASPTGANPTVTKGTTTDLMKYRAVFTITVLGGALTASVTADLSGGVTVALGTLTLGALFTPILPSAVGACSVLPPFTLTNGATVLAVGDVVTIDWLPLEPSALIGGLVYPDTVSKPNAGFRISANDHQTITVISGDMTSIGAPGTTWSVRYPSQLGGGMNTFGYDGTDGVVDGNFTAAMDLSTSKLLALKGQNKGLVKLACPGKTSTAIQKAGIALAEAMNWQYRIEIPDTTVAEDGALTLVNSTVGRSDFAVVSFPSYADVDNPDKPGQYKRISLTGAIHGREALIAKNYGGYHKAAAGIDVTLPRVISLPTVGTATAPTVPLNEELLNPQGVAVTKWVKGNAILWGDRTVSVDPAWKWKHQREQMSHYENILRESFDWIIFAINSNDTRGLLKTALLDMFRKEWKKQALRGKTEAEAYSIKIDDEINTNATMAAGDLNCEIKLRLPDTVERFVIRIGKAGIFESLT